MKLSTRISRYAATALAFAAVFAAVPGQAQAVVAVSCAGVDLGNPSADGPIRVFTASVARCYQRDGNQTSVNISGVRRIDGGTSGVIATYRTSAGQLNQHYLAPHTSISFSPVSGGVLLQKLL